MRAIVKNSALQGAIKAPASKSYTHRAIICGLLSQGETEIVNPLLCDDTEASLHLSRLMGAQTAIKRSLLINGPDCLEAPSLEMNCGGSGTTLRIFTALAALSDGRSILTGDSTLKKRPMTDLLQALRQLGVRAFSVHRDGLPPVEVHGRGLNGGRVCIRGDISSQYITGLLLACAKGRSNSSIEITTQLESKPYVEMTIEVMRKFGVHVRPNKLWDEISINGNQIYSPSKITIPGDFSSAAFPLVAGVLSGRTTISGLSQESIQGDSKITEFMKEMGGTIRFSSGRYTATHSELVSTDFDVSNTPDLVPIISVMATQAKGTTRIYNAERLRFKESDRLVTTKTELRKMGARIDETEDGLTIHGSTTLRGAVIDSHQDHRIAMACVIAGLVAEGTTTIEGIECIWKSYPDFIDHLQFLGADIKLEQTSEQEIRI